MNRARAFILSALMVTASLAAGCGDGATSPTPTQPPPGDSPGQEATVGAVMVAYVQGYDLQTGIPGGTDVASTALGAGFLNPDFEAEGGSSAGGLPIPPSLPIPEGGIALDTCSPLDLSGLMGDGGRWAPAYALGLHRPAASLARLDPEEDETPAEASFLVEAGASVEVIIEDSTYTLPLVQEEDLPPPLADQPLPPFYLLSAQGLDPDLFDLSAQYGLTAPGSEDVLAFTVAPFFSPPPPLEVSEPRALGEGGAISLEQDLDFQWVPGSGAYALIDLHAFSGQGLTCLVVDDGSFTIPAAQLGTLPEEDGLLTMGRVSYAAGEIRLNERLAGVGVVLEVAQVSLD